MLGKNKSEFLYSSSSFPNAFEPAHKYWQRCNHFVLSCIVNSINPSIAQSIALKNNPHNVWLELKEIFYQGDLIHIPILNKEIHNLRQGNGSISELFIALPDYYMGGTG